MKILRGRMWLLGFISIGLIAFHVVGGCQITPFVLFLFAWLALRKVFKTQSSFSFVFVTFISAILPLAMAFSFIYFR